MIRILNIKAELEESEEDVLRRVVKKYGLKNVRSVRICSKAVDARRKSCVHYVYAVEAECDNEQKLINTEKNVVVSEEYVYRFPKGKTPPFRPLIVGSGPAGLFAGLVLAENGYRPIIIERGKCVDERVRDVEDFRRSGILNTESNVQFGEGGAGTFSDGKLTSGIKDMRRRRILKDFVRFGAPEEIEYIAKPHIGTDKLRNIVKNMRFHIETLGGEVRFQTRLDDIIEENGRITGAEVVSPSGRETIETGAILLAAGHSARDVFDMLKKHRVLMEAKPFSVGARIEHSQELISKSQYGSFYSKLPAADYKLAVHLPNGRSAYTFCMCPGGEVVCGASEKGMIVTNGMSDFARDGKNANSALLVNVTPEDFEGVSGGVELQRRIERAAFGLGGGNYLAPAQTVGDFLANRPSVRGNGVEPTYKPGVVWGDISACLPGFVSESMRLAIVQMDKHLKGFASPEAVLTAPETRSSSPIRLVRSRQTYMLSINGLFSAGEGGGHAGGIVSAAADGIRAAEAMACCWDNY